MGISVQITAGATAEQSGVNASGSVQHIITDMERSTFGIRDSGLKSAVEKYFGKWPTDAFVRSPTPWGDLYKTYGWPEIQTILAVKHSKLLGISSEPVIVKEQEFRNSSSITGTFDCAISDQVSNSVSNTWSTTNTIEVSQSINYEVGFLGTGGGGETSFSYSHEWGESKTETSTVTVGATSGVLVELKPGQAVKARLSASRGSLKIRIEYWAYLTGMTACNYYPKYKDHHFWALSIGSVMSAGGLSNSREFTEDITVGYYSNGKIELIDAFGDVRISYPAVIGESLALPADPPPEIIV